MVKIGVYYPKIKTGVPLFGPPGTYSNQFPPGKATRYVRDLTTPCFQEVLKLSC